LRAENVPYAAAAAILSAWLVLSAGAIAPQFYGTPPPPEPLAISSALSAPALPRVMAEITVDNEQFYILVGDGPPSFGVAVSASD